MARHEKEIISKFLKYMETEKGYYLCSVDKFSKELSVWDKDNPQSSHRALLNVNIRLERLNDNDKDIQIDSYLRNKQP